MEYRSPPAAPRWVKVFGIVSAVILLVVLVLLLTGSNHGPGRHLDGGSERAPATEHSVPHP
jgi:preprotein translocase subunit SecG